MSTEKKEIEKDRERKKEESILDGAKVWSFYCVSKNSCPFGYSKYTTKNGQDFFDKQCLAIKWLYFSSAVKAAAILPN